MVIGVGLRLSLSAMNSKSVNHVGPSFLALFVMLTIWAICVTTLVSHRTMRPNLHVSSADTLRVTRTACLITSFDIPKKRLNSNADRCCEVTANLAVLEEGIFCGIIFDFEATNPRSSIGSNRPQV